MRISLRNCTNPISVRCIRKIIFNSSPTNVFVYFILLILFTVEVLIYYFATFSWHSINCSVPSECTRILLVADPQLIGLHNEKSDLLTPFSIWDSDRYLQKTFSSAFHFTQPDIVIFLGDLLDEGSTANNEEFQSYLKRLFNIFLRKPFHAVHHIWLPGDNDIGGEGNDRIMDYKVKRFERAFSQPDIVGIKNVKFYKINRLLSTIPRFTDKKDFSNLDSITVGVSHLPLLMSPAVFVDKVLEKIQPHVLFTAHTHNSMIVSTQQEMRKDRLITPVRPDNNKVYDYYLGVSDIYEILVPTCSYRMGTDKIGYGFAVIEGGSIRYTVLWTPSRFAQLMLYGFLGIVCLFCFIYLTCCAFYKRFVKGNIKNYSGLAHVG